MCKANLYNLLYKNAENINILLFLSPHKRNKKKKTIDKGAKIVYNLIANYETAVCATLVAYFLWRSTQVAEEAPLLRV